jgi:hypothetical protein
MESLRKGDDLEDPGPDGRIIINGILPRIVEWEDADWFHLAQEKGSSTLF